ncbi:MAG: hypothetical protein K2O38_01325 [Muribaculaceae bacterium]|nr:hypothetical protein [Muribaculaceae bacterium]
MLRIFNCHQLPVYPKDPYLHPQWKLVRRRSRDPQAHVYRVVSGVAGG